MRLVSTLICLTQSILIIKKVYARFQCCVTISCDGMLAWHLTCRRFSESVAFGDQLRPLYSLMRTKMNW